MTWIWILAAALTGFAGLRHRARLRAGRRPGAAPAVDDDVVRRILEEGRLGGEADEEEGDEPLDMDAAARAEDEFWDESWDEPEEFRP